ncbi:hypothetical protein BY458DRAFT_311575 [Sporodiniella umbellata]|nr:hypothetical protein BY458DRAFT_311575 [Sporodiniella umbellata]
MSNPNKRIRLDSPPIDTASQDKKKIVVKTQIVHQSMHNALDKLEESLETMYDNALSDKLRNLVKKDLREFVTSTFRSVISNVSLTDSENLDVFEGVEEPHDEELEKEANELENVLNELLEKRIRKRYLVRDEFSLVGQQCIEAEKNLEAESLSTPEPEMEETEVDWEKVQENCKAMTSLVSSLVQKVPEVTQEYKQIKKII